MNSEQQEEHQPDVGKVSLGKRLKSAREELDLSIKDVADSLRLRVSVIEEIEQDKYDDAQIPTFTRGYIRGYAKLVGINTAELLLKESALASEVQPEPSMQSFSRKTRLKKNDKRLMTLTWAILSFVVGITIIWGLQADQNDELENTANNNDVNIETAVTNSDNIATSGTKAAEEIAASLVNMQSPAGVPPTAPTASAAVEKPESSHPVTVEKPEQPEAVVHKMLSMDFIADCWIDIRDGNGKRLLTGIKSRGETVRLNGKEPFKIVLGAPSAVELTYKGKTIDLSKYPPKRVARLTLPQK